MIAEDWLRSYRDLGGIDRVLKGLNRRTGRKSGMDRAVVDLEEHYDKFESEFSSFFVELVIFSRDKLTRL